MGGSKGGGGSSGKVDYPSYMKDWHSDGLDDWGSMDSVSTLMAAAIGNSPYDDVVAYDPSTETAAIITAASGQLSHVDSISLTAVDGLSAYVDNIDVIGEVVDLEDTIIPRFESGMADINAVQSSAFVQGRANLEAAYAARLAGFKADLKTKVITGATDLHLKKAEIRDAATHKVIEANRMIIVARTDEESENIKYDELDALWDLEVIKYGGNFLGSIGGTAINQGAQSDRKSSNPLGGALAGAAAGASIGGPWGAAIGGAVGLIGGLM